MLREIVDDYDSARVTAFVVWLPRPAVRGKPVDTQEKAREAMGKVHIERAMHFWIPTKVAGTAFAQEIDDLRGSYAWDTYLVYLPGTRWTSRRPPSPGFWMHQLSGFLGRQHPRFLDPDELRKEVDSGLSHAAHR